MYHFSQRENRPQLAAQGEQDTGHHQKIRLEAAYPLQLTKKMTPAREQEAPTDEVCSPSISLKTR